MKITTLDYLDCPECQARLFIDDKKIIPSFKDSDEELQEGIIKCKECERRYPVICGVAILLCKVNSWMRANYFHVIEGAYYAGGISNSMLTYLDQQGWRMSANPNSNYYELPRWIEIFLATHYDPVSAGADDNSEVGKVIANSPSVFDFIADGVRAAKPDGAAKALDVGTNVGGMAWRLAEQIESVIAIDTTFNPLLSARKIQLGQPTPQSIIRRYIDGLKHEEIEIGPYPKNVEFLLASIFELPLTGKFDVITALNVIDVVPEPDAFIDVLIERLEQGGVLAITSPYSWGSDDVPIDNWLGDAKKPSSETLIQQLTEKGLVIEGEADCIPWVLREHQRWYRVFHNHCVIARKP